MKVALVHDFLTQYGGAERVLDAFLEIFPDADIFTLIYDKEKMGQYYGGRAIRTSFLQQLPFGVKKYKWYLALMPKAIESFDFSGYDLVLSDASAFAKGIIVKKPTLHVCYLHTPIRYLWSDRVSYIKSAPIPFFIRPLMPLVVKYLQTWDLRAAKRPDFCIPNSGNVNLRTQKYYHRKGDAVIWPPVNGKNFYISPKQDNYFFLVSRAEPYKKSDLVVEAFNKLGSSYKLVIAGSGTKMDELKRMAKDNITFVGRVSDQKLADLYARCQALIFPQKEDAGITMLESMASGRPVIAYKEGGALEIIEEGINGEFLAKQDTDSIIRVVKSFKSGKYNPKHIREHALKFDKEIFKAKINKFIADKINK